MANCVCVYALFDNTLVKPAPMYYRKNSNNNNIEQCHQTDSVLC